MGVQRKSPLIIWLAALSLFLQGCVYLPRTVESEEDQKCNLITRKLVIERSDDLSAGALIGCYDVACIYVIAGALAVPTATYIVSGSVAVAGNSIHWLEREGRCDDGSIRKGMESFYMYVAALGGKIVNSGREILFWIGLESDPLY